MSAGTFQVPLPHPAQLAGRIEATLVDPGGNPPDIVKAGTPLDVQFHWELTGSLVPLIAGSWQLRVNIDQLGGPVDTPYPTTPDTVAVTPNNGTYNHTIQIPAIVMPPGPNGNTYKLVAALTYTTPAGTPGPLAGYVDCGIVQVIP